MQHENLRTVQDTEYANTIADISMKYPRTGLITNEWKFTLLISFSLGVWGEEAQDILSKCAEKLAPSKQGLYTQL